MNFSTELEAMRRHLDKLADESDNELMKRYALRRPRLPQGMYWRMRWLAARVLHGLEWMRIKPPNPWPSALRHAPSGARAKPLLIWAVGTDRETLREACLGFSRWQGSAPGFAPVLITDVADFSFFSRLGWLVEYLPKLAGEGEPYEARKARFLARIYRGAPALPASIGLEMESRAEELVRWLAR